MYLLHKYDIKDIHLMRTSMIKIMLIKLQTYFITSYLYEKFL